MKKQGPRNNGCGAAPIGRQLRSEDARQHGIPKAARGAQAARPALRALMDSDDGRGEGIEAKGNVPQP